MTLTVPPGTGAAEAVPQRASRIVLIDNQRIFRHALRALLNRQQHFAVVGDAAEGGEALELIAAERPDVVVTELHLGGGPSVQHLAEIRARFPGVALLVLTALRAHDVAARVRRAGARGYVLKDHSHDELLKALREVAAGRCYRSDVRAVGRACSLAGEAGAVARLVDLTERQRQVLRSLALGYRTREIAQRLGVSVKAVHKQRERIRDVLQLDSIAALTRFAAREGCAEEALPAPE